MNEQNKDKIDKYVKLLEKQINILEDVKMDEEYAFDSMPSNLQGSIKGEDSENAIAYLEDAIDRIEKAVENLNSIK